MILTNGQLDRQRVRVREWLGLILAPGQVAEIRAIDPFRTRTFATAAAGELDRMAEFACRLSGECRGVYFVPNPLRTTRGSGSQGTALDRDIERRLWLLVDFDSVRPTNTNATDAERAAAWAVCEAVRATLEARGLSRIVVGDSGNGYHQMIPVDLPNDDESRGIHKLFLQALQERFGSAGAVVDTTTHNAARLWKLPGTLARKGEPTPDRPHRHARLLTTPEAPHEAAAANTALFRELVAHWAPHRQDRASGVNAYARAALERECGRMACASAGKLNDQLFKSGANLGEFVGAGLLAESEVVDRVMHAARAAGCDNPGKDMGTLLRGIEQGKKHPRNVVLADAAAAAAPWEKPVPIDARGLDRFPADVFPAGLRQFVREQSLALNVPPDYLGLMMLGVAGGAIGTTKRLRIKAGYTQSSGIYGVFVARPGVRKSAAVRAVTAPLYVAQDRYEREYRTQKDDWHNTGQQGEEPKLKQVVINTGTVEAIARVIAANTRGVVMAVDELSGLVAGMNQYKAGGKGSDRQFFLSAWDQSAYSVERVESGRRLYLPRPFLAILGAIQPDVFGSLRGEPDRMGNPPPDDGFFDRFLVACPPEPRDEGETWLEVSNAAEQAWASAVEGLLSLLPQPDGKAQYVPLGLDAKAAYQEFTKEHAAEVNDDAFPDHLRGPWSKLIGYFARFILILHSLDQVCDGLVDYEADSSHVSRAAKLTRYFKSHGRRGQTLAHETRADRQARFVMDWCRRHQRTHFSEADLWRDARFNKRLFGRREDLTPALRLLEDLSHIRKVPPPPPTGTSGRPPGPAYDVNPHAGGD